MQCLFDKQKYCNSTEVKNYTLEREENIINYWLISANHRYYNHDKAFRELGAIDWRDNQRKYEVGDVVYIYSTSPFSNIKFKCLVVKTNIKFEEKKNDSDYWLKDENEKEVNRTFIRLRLIKEFDTIKFSLSELKKNGLKVAPQAPIRIKGELLEYIQKIDDEVSENVIESNPEEEAVFIEGGQIKIIVNRYERSPHARSMCIEHHGYGCKVCGMNFLDVYGEIGREYIHVHHLIPISEIGEDYRVNPVRDLIPVCPNCHAMLHSKKDKSCYSIKELKEIMKQSLM